MRPTGPSAGTPLAETSAIAKEAFLYGFPLVSNYHTLYQQAVDTGNRDYRAPFNTVGSAANVATPDDTFVVTPNSDTPYSFLWLDLRAEPVVITMPKIEKGRYYTGQLIDLYTFNFAYLGTRLFGNAGGKFLVAGPGWKGTRPKGITTVYRAETELAYVLFRTQLFDAADLANVQRIQAGIRAEPLSRFLGGTPPPTVPPAIAWPKPTETMTTSPEAFRYLNFLLGFCPPHPSETELIARFAKIGVGAGWTFDLASRPRAERKAIEAGIADAWQELAVLQKKIDAREVSSAEFFGTRAFLKNNYLYRFAGAKLGRYGNSGAEAIYLTYFVDANGKPADGSKTGYTLRFAQGQLPPAGAFWSLTMYDGKTQLLVANPLQRYLVNSPMLKSFTYGADGSLTLYVQKDSPGREREANWLPAPNGPFYAVLRIYMPAKSVVDGTWKQPLLQPVVD
ncbi:MAG: DUF1254 domain-containing protein [Candidatus Binatia bacterium]